MGMVSIPTLPFPRREGEWEGLVGRVRSKKIFLKEVRKGAFTIRPLGNRGVRV